MEQLHEMEHLGYCQQDVSRDRSIDKQHAERAARDDAKHGQAAFEDGQRGGCYEEASLSTRAIEQACAEEQRLLDDEHEHAGQDEVAITAR